MTEPSPGLRELRKRETRQAISDIATRMFLERGFDKVTIADVAKAARVAKMTVTNYFPRKEDLVFDMQDAFTAGLAQAVYERRRGESALAALRRDFLERVAAHDPVLGFTGPAFGRLIQDSPALTGRLRDFYDMREAALAEALRAETGAGDDDLLPALVAAQFAGVLRVLASEIRRLSLAGEPAEAIEEAVTARTREAFALLEEGLGGYAVRT